MKKTLIALAVLSASAAAFASVTITGDVEAGYIASNNVNGKAGDQAGFGINKSKININSTEDLGNGIKVAAQLGLQGADRSSANDLNTTAAGVTGGDSFLNIISPVGTVGISSSAGVDYLSDPTSISGVAGYSFSGNDANYFLYGANTANTSVNYTADVGPVKVELSHEQAKASPIGTGITGPDVGQRDNAVGVTYKIGGFAANVGYKSYDSSAATPANFATPLIRQVIRGQAAYDFGVAKIGGGVSSTNYTDGRPNTTTWLVGAAAPVGPLTLGAQITNINSVSTSQAAPLNGKFSDLKTADQIGVAYTAKYDLSKQTSLKAAYARWQQTNTTGYNTSEVSVLLAHSF